MQICTMSIVLIGFIRSSFNCFTTYDIRSWEMWSINTFLLNCVKNWYFFSQKNLIFKQKFKESFLPLLDIAILDKHPLHHGKIQFLPLNDAKEGQNLEEQNCWQPLQVTKFDEFSSKDQNYKVEANQTSIEIWYCDQRVQKYGSTNKMVYYA